jgi:exo-beta-1,3-glucanase (GH17 family)
MLLALLVALVNFAMWGAANQATYAPDVAARVNGLTYAPYGRSGAPWVPEAPTASAIAADLKQLSTLTGKIRTYSAAQFPELPGLAAAAGLELTLGVWLNGDADNNAREMAAAVQAARTHANVTRLVVGNETVLKQQLTPAQLIRHLQQARARTPLPISTAEPWHVWIKHPELADQVDFITVHLLPYWEGVGLETAVDESMERLARVRARFPGKPIVVGEIGYPSSGNTIGRAKPSPSTNPGSCTKKAARALIGACLTPHARQNLTSRAPSSQTRSGASRHWARRWRDGSS